MINLNHSIFMILGVAALNCAVPISSYAQSNIPNDGIEIFKVDNPLLVQTAIAQALDAGQVDSYRFLDKPGMKAFYETRGFEAVWLQSSFVRQRKSETLLKVFQDSWKHGLNPRQYRVEEIKSLMETAKGSESFKLDLVLSDALVRYGRDMTGMRVNPQSIGQRSKYWRQPLRSVDILEHVASGKDTSKALDAITPQGKLYTKLQSELEALYKVESKGYPEPVSVKGILKPGANSKSVLAVRERMGFKPENAIEGPYYYDDQLASAVMAFQKAKGVTPDGIVGPQTVKLMNITSEDRINQILVNLERLRWMEPIKPERYVMVNVPSAMLWAVDQGKVEFEMPVVVGREKRQTNIFTTEINGIRFNPRWTVPPTIKRDDYLPKLRENPYYLTDRGIELVDGNNRTIDPGQIDWKQKTWGEVNAMRMVQGSGSRNPLGFVRVLMNNPYNIYLHDTPNKSYFSRASRALSSGCVRMAEPQKLADFVLQTNEGWSDARKEKILSRGRQADILADHPIPVYILYQTVWLGDNDQIVYGTDLYGHDPKLLNELKKMDGVVYPAAAESVRTAENTLN